MKFDEGQWRLLAGTEATYSATITEVRTEADALIVTGYDHHIHHRANYCAVARRKGRSMERPYEEILVNCVSPIVLIYRKYYSCLQAACSASCFPPKYR